MTLAHAEHLADAEAFVRGLEAVDPAELALQRDLQRPRQPWHGQLAEQPISVRWNAPGVPADGPQLALAVSLGDAPLQLNVPARALALLGLPEASAPLELADILLLEQALLSLIEPLEQVFEQPIRLRDRPVGGLAGLAPTVWPLGVRLAGETLPVHLRTDAATWTQIAALLERHVAPQPNDLGGLRLPLTADAGEAWLTLAELRSLLPGDVVMLDAWPDRQVRLRLEDQWQARVQRDGLHLQLLEPPITELATKEPHMSEQGTGPSLDTRLDELQLKLVCQVGSVELTLAQLRELGEGSVLQLTPSMQDGVDLLINGRRVGQGQLVKLGDGLGVRLLSFAAS